MACVSQHNIPRVYAYKAFLAVYSFVLPMMIPLYRMYGISVEQVSILQTAYAISIALWQIPSGWLADRYGRKLVLIIGAVLGAISRFIYGFGDSFEVFLVGEILLGTGLAFISGADIALLYDSLATIGRTDRFQQTVATSRAVELMIGGICAVLSGYVAHLSGLHAVFLLSSVGFAVMVIIAATLVEPAREYAPAGIKAMTRLCLEQIITKPTVIWCIIFFSLLFAINQPVVFMWEPFLRSAGVALSETGWFFCGMFFWGAFIGWLTPRLSQRLGGFQLLAILLVVDILSLLGVSLFVSPYCALFFLGHQSTRAGIQIAVPAIINKEVDSRVRATIISVLSMSGFLLYSLVFIPLGKFQMHHSLQQSLMVLALLLLIGGSSAWFLRPAHARVRR